MVIKRKDFQKAAAFIHEFLLKLPEDSECSELRDSLNLALLHMQKYYRVLQHRNHEKSVANTLSLTARGLSPMTPFVDAPDKFQYKWINLDSTRLLATMGLEESTTLTMLPPIIQAAKQGNTDLITELINSDPSCSDDQDGLGRSALTYAVHFHQMEALQCLLDNEANPNVTAHDGSTAIHQACHDSNNVALSYLLQYGGDFTMPDTHGRAPIHWAVTTPSTECLQCLISHNADVTIRDKDGLSPCMWACRLDHIEHFQLLCESENFHVDDADGVERDIIGRTWMHWAVRRMEPLECLQTLLTAQTAAIKDDEGRTVLLTAAETGALPACKIILEIGGKQCIHDRDNNLRNALHLATVGGHGDVVNFLLEQGTDLTALDKFNATPWDYAKNRQLHYCQLIIMSHQRQRLASNPTSPIPNGLGLMLGSSMMMNGDFDTNMDFDYMSNRASIDSQPITPPHPPKRPRTSGMPVRRSRSLTSQDRDRFASPSQSLDRQINSAGESMTRHNGVEGLSYEQGMEGPMANSGDNAPRRKERIEVSVNPRKSALDDYENGDKEEAMATEDHLGVYEDIDGVSVGGMDVSDIEDENDHIPHTARGPPSQRSPGPPPRQMGPQRSPIPNGPQYNHQPSPPTRYQPRPPQHYTQAMQAPYRRSPGFPDEPQQSFESNQPKPPLRSPNPPPGGSRGPGGGYFNRSPSPNPVETFPPPNRPLPAPRPPRMQQSPKAPPRRTPSPTKDRPGSGPTSRDQLSSPPTGQMSDQSMKDQGRPDSTGRPPGVLEGKKLVPPPMLMPLENAPKPPNLDKVVKRRKKKRRERAIGQGHSDANREVDRERERDVKSPPEDLTPPRGYAAPLHPPPSATTRQQRAQSGIPSPKFSKGAPQKSESRYVEENMEEERMEQQPISDKPPMVNGMAVPLREAPMRSARPNKRTPPMESEEYDNGHLGNGDTMMQDDVINEDEEIGPLIPPPQGFRGPSARPGGGRPLSQSVPQDRSSSRSTSAKPPLPRGRNNGSASGPTRYKTPSPARRSSRPPTGKTEQ